MNKEVKKEIGKAVAASGAAFVGAPVAATIAASLGVAIEVFSSLSQKRSTELFNSEEYTAEVISKIKQSDNFASFVYDVWLKHNFESSEQRRKYLRNMLKKETYNSTNPCRFQPFCRHSSQPLQHCHFGHVDGAVPITTPLHGR